MSARPWAPGVEPEFPGTRLCFAELAFADFGAGLENFDVLGTKSRLAALGLDVVQVDGAACKSGKTGCVPDNGP